MTLPRSLRGRLTLLFSGATLVVVAAAAFGMTALLDRAIWAPLDAALEEEAETLAVILDQGSTPDLMQTVATVGREREDTNDKFIRILASDAHTVASVGIFPPKIAAEPLPAAGTTRLATLWSDAGEPLRVVWFPAANGGWSVIGVGVASQTAMQRRAHMTIGAGAAALLLVLAFFAWATAFGATADLSRLAQELEKLEVSTLDRRLASRHTNEVDRLVTVLNRLLGRLEAAMTHLRRFTADAAHELRTPIAALRARLEIAIRRTDAPEASRDGLLDALEQTERLARLAEDLLTLSTVEADDGAALTHDRVRLDVLAHEVAEFLEPVAQEQGRRFECEASRPVVVRATVVFIKRLLLNLVDNAFRHTPATAKVRVAVSAHDAIATLEVSDEGPGIAADDLEFAFERFRRGRGASGGSGLGLALCREIAVRMGGDIVLRSRPGTGTTVRVTLPLVEE